MRPSGSGFHLHSAGYAKMDMLAEILALGQHVDRRRAKQAYPQVCDLAQQGYCAPANDILAHAL